jgi:UDP-N-acetylglucosamine diphosphorylase / glucose-1-phosphate thymidylyltransferase / UDP-N-acetylgalactosamine diphosphorylase / glucosamine-1-phosphate N-acetyltransferase / galactosamine-1-phosphate N-acetyltransferase
MNKSLLSHQMDRLKKGGMEKVIFVGGHHNIEMVHDIFPNVPSIEQEDLDLGMRGALLSALPEIKDDSVCIVSSNDVIESSAYASLIEASKKDGVDGVMLAQKVKKYFPGGYLVTAPDSNGDMKRVAGIVEKPKEGSEPSDLVNIVAHVHNNPEKLLDILEDVSSDRDDAYEVALTKLCKDFNYVALPYEGKWNAVKYPWHVLDITERCLSDLPDEQSIHKSAEVDNTAVVRGKVVIEEGVKIMPHATVQGPCFIGKGTIIGNNCLIRDSIVGDKCVIGYGSEVARCNLHSHVWTHSTYLGDSVIGKNVAFGAGSIAANFRLDEGIISSVVKDEKISTQRNKLGVIVGDNVRIGVNTSFAPGTKIGSGTFVNSAISVTKDVGEKKFITLKDGEIVVKDNNSSIPGIRD